MGWMKLRRRSRRPLRRFKTVTLRSRVKQERNRRLGKIILVCLVTGSLAYGGWWTWKTATNFLFTSDAFKIRAIEVRGGKNITQSEILALLPFRPGDNIVKLWISETEKNIQQCKPELQRISVRRGWKKVIVSLEERQPVACVMLDGQRLGLDAENKVFPLRGKLVREALPEVTCRNETDRKEILEFVRLFAPAAKELYPNVVRFGLESLNDIVFDFKGGPRVFWGPLEKDQLESKLKRLAQVMDDAKARFSGMEYINLCYFDNGRILVKPKENQRTIHSVLLDERGKASVSPLMQEEKKGI